MNKRIFFVTGARSDFDLMSPIIRELENYSNLKASVVVCGAHLSPFHGNNIENIKNDGFEIAGIIESLLSSESWEGRSLSFAYLHEGLTRLLSKEMPDMVFVSGDREEALAAALVGCFLRIPVAHSHGGDRCLASDIDEVFRPAISKLVNLHFVATPDHAKRLEKMGEKKDSIWMTGAAGLDRWNKQTEQGNEIISKKYGLSKNQKYFLVIHHPSPTLSIEQGVAEIKAILNAALSFDVPVFCSYPNFDPGNIAIRNEIDRFSKSHSKLIAYHNLPSDEFTSLYINASAIVGNSSSIVTESGFLKVPGILVGRRQELRSIGPNVLTIPAEKKAIIEACEKCLNDNDFKATVAQGISIYGDGTASKKIAKILSEVEFNEESLLKTITY